MHTMRAELLGHFKACMAEIYLHIDARMADYIHTHLILRGLPVATAVCIAAVFDCGDQYFHLR